MSELMQETSVPALPGVLEQALAECLERGEIELPVLPEVASEVITASMDESCDLRRLTALINRDQAMTGHLLRLSNSALYAPPTPIVSLQQALNRLGLKKIREIARIISCESKVFRVAGFDATVRELFRHSLAAAAYSQEIARHRRWNVEEGFLCGLLHDVGQPVLLQAIVDLSSRHGIEAEPEAILAASTRYHCQVGFELVRSWNLPSRMSEAIRFHHDPEGAECARQPAMMTCLADDLAYWSAGLMGLTREDLEAHRMVIPLNVYPDEMDRLLGLKDQIQGAVESVA